MVMIKCSYLYVDSKTLSLNLQKSAYIIFGSKKQRKGIQSKLKDNPLMLSGQQMSEVKSIKYLEDWLMASQEESVHQTVLKHLPIAKQSIAEIRAVVEDISANNIDCINLAYTLFDSTVASMLLRIKKI